MGEAGGMGEAQWKDGEGHFGGAVLAQGSTGIWMEIYGGGRI